MGHEKVCGQATDRRYERFDHAGSRFVVFGMWVSMASEQDPGASIYYNVRVPADLVDFALKEVEKGRWVTVEGPSQDDPWKDKSGATRAGRIMFARSIAIMGGPVAVSVTPVLPPTNPQELSERDLAAHFVAAVEASPFRWQTAPFAAAHPETAAAWSAETAQQLDDLRMEYGL